MTDQNAPVSPFSYVDDYAPPAAAPAATPAPVAAPSMPAAPTMPPAPAMPPMPPMGDDAGDNMGKAGEPASPVADKISQSLEDQNIFHLLGLEAASDEEKESFLDELQQIIWEDFLENDVELLLTEEELVEFKKIGDKVGATEEDRQAEMVEFLEKLIPDLEKIMLEKALELKEEMVRERVNELLKIYATNEPLKLQSVQEAQKLMDDQQWRAAAEMLNAIE